MRKIDQNRIQFEDPITRQNYTWDIAKVTTQIFNHELSVVGADTISRTSSTDEDKGTAGLLTSIDSLPEKYRSELEFRIRVVKWIKKNGASRGQRDVISGLLKKFPQEPGEGHKLPTASTAMHWVRLWDSSGGNPSSLVTKNFGRSRKKAFSREQEAEITKVLLKEYFTRSRPTLQYVAMILNRRLKELAGNQHDVRGKETISIPSLHRRVLEVNPYIRDVHRFGAAFARNRWRYSLRGPEPIRALQRLEVDHTILDMVVVADGTGMPLGRPVITVIIDAYSSYCVGFYISFAGAGLAPVLNAMKVGLMPKSAYTDHAQFLQQTWYGYGLGEMYVVDNGLEFHSRQFVSAATELNTDIQYCPVRQPWLKPNVERFFGELGNHLPAPGKVLKPVANSLPLDPSKTASISFSDLCKGLLQYFVDVYPLKINSRTLARPIDLFPESFERTPPSLLPSNLDSLGLIAAKQITLTVGNEGIAMPGLRFNCPELQLIRRELSVKFKTQVKYDPENLGFVYVQHPKTLDWLYVPNCRPEYANNLSVIQHKTIRAHINNSHMRAGHRETYMQAKLELSEKWLSMARGKTLHRDNKLAAKFAGLSSARCLLPENSVPAVPLPSQFCAPVEPRKEDMVTPTFDAYLLD
ncbi:Mu transposase C-terminal domain-containing protein [Undibacterium sp.]|uniref:Mu transposase C-terminal domain-containing protein n=1 Tax=Undibacterium sp. TaxID=1914977 RepID=UPI0027321CF1|nr:Mu transposase C-terminal domain-containing protein [Undibacterium sp.]MDP1979392.1 Mu transposase C-terminal domain-containing protein [Undibacterium sp.]